MQSREQLRAKRLAVHEVAAISLLITFFDVGHEFVMSERWHARCRPRSTRGDFFVQVQATA